MTPLLSKVRLCQAKKHRNISFVYYMIVGTNSRRVCKKAFIQLHMITASKVYHIGQQVAAGRSAPSPCLRGKHSNRPSRISVDMELKVKEHISLFPVDESHYLRNKTCRKYLSSSLNISIMYRLYKEWCNESCTPHVSARTYRDIFNNKFNLSFGCPKSDTCSVCDAETSSDIGAHKLRAKEGFAVMNDDRKQAAENGNIVYITVDMQKTLPLPKLTTSVAFYLRQLWLYNVGIHFVRKNESRAYFNLWSEDEADRGCEEVGSAIFAFVEAADLHGHLVVWSDSCAGQNKNFFIICLWQYFIAHGR